MKYSLALLLLACATAANAAEPRFEFHVGFWINLHQRLLAESGARTPPDRVEPSDAAAAQAWQGVVEWYRRRWPGRTLLTQLYDETLIAAERKLATAADDAQPTGLDAELTKQLVRAAPIYRASKWPADQSLDRAWIAELRPRLDKYGARLETMLPRLFAAQWPAPPLRVEVARYAGPVGAFTLTEPALITISSGDPRDRGEPALEVLFHEASHTLAATIERTLPRVCPPSAPRTLWHAVLFYLSGAAVQKIVGPGYQPYAEHNGLYTRGDWTGLGPLLARALGPTVDGTRPLEPSLQSLCASLPRQP